MADEAEDVLELEVENIEATEPEVEADPDADGDDEETFVGFDGEDEGEAAPASESESSVIREMRRKLREAERENKTLRQSVPQPKVELGPKPTLESCEYDEGRFEAEFVSWTEQKAKVEAQERAQTEAADREKAEWDARVETYNASKASLTVTGYEEAEAEVFSVLPNEVQALILRAPDKAPALVYALARSPGKLEELSKLNLADAAMMVGELRAKVKVERRSKLPEPDRPVNGRAGTPSAANLERLRDKARKSGNWDDYFAAKRAAQS